VYLILEFLWYHVDLINVLSNFEDANAKEDSNEKSYASDCAVPFQQIMHKTATL